MIALAIKMKNVVVIEPDKTEIKEALVKGETINGAELVTDKYKLVIK